MFSKLIFRNSKRNRKDNNLYFSSMIISIIAFYFILSLPNQDVMLFLKGMESDAVGRLMSIIPVFYIMTLFILFFLVFFASSLQVERRRHEFGVYLTLGMKRSKLFFMLLLEDLQNNLITLGIGLPLALMLSELISLITARVVGLGILGHQFSFSLMAIMFTVIGFLTVKLLVFVFLSFSVIYKEIGDLLNFSPAGINRHYPSIIYGSSIVIAVAMLGKAYEYGMSGKAWRGIDGMGITVLSGCIGTVLLFFGMRLIISFIINLGKGKKLHTYNFRQIQELVILRSTTLALCSLLVFFAVCFFGAGVAISVNNSYSESHILDYTFRDDTLKSEENLSVERVKNILRTGEIESHFVKVLGIRIGYLKQLNSLSLYNFINEIKNADSDNKATKLLNNLQKKRDCYLIALDDYNELRKVAGLEPIKLEKGEVSLYMGERFLLEEELLNIVLCKKPEIQLMNSSFNLTGKVESLPVVADRAISLSFALIVPEDQFISYTGDYSNYVSGVLNPDIVKEKGLMAAIIATNEKLNKTTLGYESYIQNMGRQLFYIISASYITIYLAIVLLVVANTIIAVQFLMGQQKFSKRYKTLIHLGATYETLCQCAGKQINWYFGLPIFVALINSFFGIQSLFVGILAPSSKVLVKQQIVVAMMTVMLLAVIELIYLRLVKKNSDRYLWTLMQPQREE